MEIVLISAGMQPPKLNDRVLVTRLKWPFSPEGLPGRPALPQSTSQASRRCASFMRAKDAERAASNFPSQNHPSNKVLRWPGRSVEQRRTTKLVDFFPQATGQTYPITCHFNIRDQRLKSKKMRKANFPGTETWTPDTVIWASFAKQHTPSLSFKTKTTYW